MEFGTATLPLYCEGSENVVADYLSRSNWDDHSACSAMWYVKSIYIYINCKYVVLLLHYSLYDTVDDSDKWWYDVTLKVSCMRCKILFDNTVLNIIYTGCLKSIHYIIYIYAGCLKNIYC